MTKPTVLVAAAVGIALGGLAATAEAQTVVRGIEVYNRACRRCHGAAGDGRGFEGWAMGIRPRNLKQGVYKYSSAGGTPTAQDVERVVKRGIPRSPMPHHTLMSEAERDAVVRYLMRRFPGRFDKAADPVEVPPVPPTLMTAASVTRGRHLYALLQCDQCHGVKGRGDGPSAETLPGDAWGTAQRPADLTEQALRSGPEPADLYRTILSGLGGTSMPSYAEAFEDPDGILVREGDAWNLVAYVLSISGGDGTGGSTFRH